MCTLYKMRRSVEEIERLFGPLANPGVNLPVYEEVYPKYEAPILRRAEPGARPRLETMVWGVPPPGDAKRPVVNVRNLASPFWRPMLANPAQRCLVPADSFAEWTGEKGSKTKVWFGVKDAPLFAFAGVWRRTPDGPRMAILTCAANAVVAEVHPQAMPVVLAPGNHERWLDADYEGACALAGGHADGAVEADVLAVEIARLDHG